MNTFSQGRYSIYIKPILSLIDLSIVIGFAKLWFFKNPSNNLFILLISLSWIVLSLILKFYEVYRYTKQVTIMSLIVKQFVLYTIIVFAASGLYNNLNISPITLFRYVLIVFLTIGMVKFFVYFLLKKYRSVLGGNYRTTVILGKSKQGIALENFFNENPEYGYIHKKTFCFKEKNKIDLEKCFKYIKEESVDELYCSISDFSNTQIYEIINFADNNLKILKFIPDTKNIISRKLKYEYYNYISILSLRNIPMQDPVNQFINRVFDLVFSSFIIIFLLSWLTPVIAILIKLESKGPVFFKQSRNGFNNKEFYCYKFRSMTPNIDANNNQATRNDQRITKIGKFIRKTSIDELPQFFNVFLGDMSVVGPRPHMVKHTNLYAKKIDKFMVRHFVKPGITGLAQVSGFRGEIETDNDIINRVKYDIFYIENWSLLLDLKIILQTFLNAIKGEEKAY